MPAPPVVPPEELPEPLDAVPDDVPDGVPAAGLEGLPECVPPLEPLPLLLTGGAGMLFPVPPPSGGAALQANTNTSADVPTK
jgi:hypothetical protein